MSREHWTEDDGGHGWERCDGLRVFLSAADDERCWRINALRAARLGYEAGRDFGNKGRPFMTSQAAMTQADIDYPLEARPHPDPSPPVDRHVFDAEAYALAVEDMPKHTMSGPDEYHYAAGTLRDALGYPDDNPKTAYGDKKAPIHLVPPTLLVSVAGVFKLGARKYGPYNWRDKTVSSSVYQGAMLRHLMAWWDGETIDPESGESHLAHVAACAGILLDAAANEKLNDDRPVTGCAGELIRAAEEEAA